MKFRFKALDKRRQPDQLDSPMLLVTPPAWVAVFVVLITTVFVAIWGFLGTIPRTAHAHGLLTTSRGVMALEATHAGVLEMSDVRLGEMVEAGRSVAVVTASDGTRTEIVAPETGRIVSAEVEDGAFVSPGRKIVALERGVESEPLQVRLLVGADQVAEIETGQVVTMAVPGVNPRVHGRLRGTVAWVSDYPVTSPAPDAEPAGDTPGGVTAAQGTVVGPHAVTVLLQPDPASPSGYAWTSQTGPELHMTSQTPVAAEIQVGSVSPVSLLIGG